MLLRERYKAAITAVIEGDREVARVQAARAALVEQALLACLAVGFTDQSSGGPAWSPDVVTQRILVTELAVALRLSESDARRLVDTAEGLTGPFTDTRAALEAGLISYRHAEKIIQHAATLPPECVADFQARLLPVARRVSVQRLTRHARAEIEQAQPATAIGRHLAAAANRRLSLDPAADGMAFLTLFLPAVEAVAIFNRATDLAKGLKAASDPRTLTQLRVDTLTDLMLNNETCIPGATKGIRPHVNVTVPALTLLRRPHDPNTRTRNGTGTGTDAAVRRGTGPTLEGHDAGSATLEGHEGGAAGIGGYDTGPAMLEGYGPIDRLTALRLTKDAPGFYRILTDPATGITLNYGRTRYRPPQDLDQLIRTTHSECTFPLDCTPSATADLDHTEPWETGANTSLNNLSPLCTSHHKVKHHTEWHIVQDPAGTGTITWTSPAGFEYIIEPTPITRPTPHFTSSTSANNSNGE
ncbi:MAG: uncharacterized protein JWQ64_972 [Subtercola sp.]|nr:uncharacterized protein [Subtercola sp.]